MEDGRQKTEARSCLPAGRQGRGKTEDRRQKTEPVIPTPKPQTLNPVQTHNSCVSTIEIRKI